ncbi:unnamed protein product [Zymoseptoria tritici ST99CH_1A5]|uniref:Uncharacterized protein n=1 Tax=Zymoseptoria tritici ST99CH_1A5 TaxID=1276529 RepID=A0A1Y6LNZ5_ZYMTR|nr:unnamed protein product [Zymoseptoria tritici ST99CH_1A5]
MSATEDSNQQPSRMLDVDTALELVASFFPQEWAITDVADIQTKLIAGGLNNTLQLSGDAEEPPATFEHFDWNGELDWVVKLFEQYECKTTVMHGDSNYVNILVRNSPAKDQCPIVLIDYETISYGYRGFDIGGHFIERMYSYKQADSQLTGYPMPSAEE